MATLRILSGNQKGEKFEIDRDMIIIGRSSKNVVSIDDPSVSGEHCAILREGRKFTIRDMNSTNGTRLNDVPITEYRLSPKDVIRAGNIDIQIEGKDIDAAPTSNTFTHPEDTQVTVRMDTAQHQPSVDSGPSVFETKKETRKTWILIFSMIGVAVLVVTVIFVLKIFRG